jgi:hypothetical protein
LGDVWRTFVSPLQAPESRLKPALRPRHRSPRLSHPPSSCSSQSSQLSSLLTHQSPSRHAPRWRQLGILHPPYYGSTCLGGVFCRSHHAPLLALVSQAASHGLTLTHMHATLPHMHATLTHMHATLTHMHATLTHMHHDACHPYTRACHPRGSNQRYFSWPACVVGGGVAGRKPTARCS